VTNSLSRRVRTGLFYALRTAFRLTPMPQGTRDKLRERFLDTKGHWVPEGPKGKAPTGDLPRRPYVRSDERAIGYVPYEKGELPDPLPATLVAFYLPQFHTIPENDEWWGKGFTEWRNVTRALPQFEGHYQPKLPGDLGFYDLRNVEVMHEQARLAREYGISAFCFYFYWFGGKTLLETPLRNWLNDKTIDLKFCLCWANEKWTRTWDGRGDEILIDQQHSPEDDIAFIEHVAEYMRDPRYLRVDGKPILLVYRPGIFKDAGLTAQRWRDYCIHSGIGEIHLAYVQSFEKPQPTEIGFDAAIEFPPNSSSTPLITAQLPLINTNYAGVVLDWRTMANSFMERRLPDYLLHRGVNVGWDNEARRPGRGRTFVRTSAEIYREWLIACCPNAESHTDTPPLVFINAWNEWAEGAVLEPDSRYGYAALEHTRGAIHAIARLNEPNASTTEPPKPCVIIHAWHLEILDEILDLLSTQHFYSRLIVTTILKNRDAVDHALVSRGLKAEIIISENRGRDILPFLRVACMLSAEGVELILKLHTKKSPHLKNGNDWRRELLTGLANPTVTNTIISSFATRSDLGMVTADGHLLSAAQYPGSNVALMLKLCGLMGVTMDGQQHFPAGSMFWARLSVLTPLLNAPLVDSDFEEEDGQIDGTMAHAIERLFGVIVNASGYKIATTAQLRNCAAIVRRENYPYVKRAN
jgi:lipopolysaccharide biosynthesis protein